MTWSILWFHLLLPAALAGLIAEGEFVRGRAEPTAKKIVTVCLIVGSVFGLLLAIFRDLVINLQPVNDLLQFLFFSFTVFLFPCLPIVTYIAKVWGRIE